MPAGPLTALKESKLDGIGNGSVPGIVRVQVVATVVGGQEPGRMIRIVAGAVLIDDCIAAALPADYECVELLAADLFLRTPVVGTLKRGEGGAEELHMVLVCRSNEPLCRLDQLTG
jgi:hypothetical protein